MNKTIEISSDAATDLIPCLESRLAWLENEVETLLRQRDSVKTTLAELLAKLSGGELPLKKNGKYPERMPKGHGEKLIVQVLASLPVGEGLPMVEIEKRSGVNHATVHRTLTNPNRNKGRFVQDNGAWKLVPNKN